MKFEKYLFNLSLNNFSVTKYSDNKEIVLVVEKEEEAVSDPLVFEDKSKYETWLDTIVDENDMYYNKARALFDVINAIENKRE